MTLFLFQDCTCHVCTCMCVYRGCCVAELLPTQHRDAELEQQTCATDLSLMTVYTLEAVLCILLCSACLPLDSKHTTTHHLCLHTFLVQQWRKHQLPVHYLSTFQAGARSPIALQHFQQRYSRFRNSLV